jgi:hypothetical protein
MSRNAMEEDMRLLGLFDLDEQLQAMERSGDPPSSTYGKLSKIGPDDDCSICEPPCWTGKVRRLWC